MSTITGEPCSVCGFGKAYQCKRCGVWFCDFCAPFIGQREICIPCWFAERDEMATAVAREKAGLLDAPSGEEIARELGIHYDSVQIEIGMQFTDIQQTGTTFYANTLEEARIKLAEKRELFGQQGENPGAPTVTLYHGTNREAAARALREGLQPQPGVETDFPSTYLAYDPLEAAKYGEVVLRVELPKEELEYMQETLPGYMRTTYPIESKYVSVYSGSPTTATGTCYEDAWRFLMQQNEGYLIHGSLRLSAEGPRVNHAWAESPPGWIWEPQTKCYYLIEDFAIFQPVEEVRYTVEEAAIMLARVGKHGPWSAEERMEHIGR